MISFCCLFRGLVVSSRYPLRAFIFTCFVFRCFALLLVCLKKQSIFLCFLLSRFSFSCILPLALRLLHSTSCTPLLALLHSPLKLPGEDSAMVVALQAISVRENVDSQLGRRNPEATVRHRGESNGKAAGPTNDIFRRFGAGSQPVSLANTISVCSAAASSTASCRSRRMTPSVIHWKRGVRDSIGLP